MECYKKLISTEKESLLRTHRKTCILRKVLAAFAAVILATVFTIPAFASGGLELSTRYTGIYAKPGDTLNFDLDFSNYSDSVLDVTLSAAGLPEHWTGYFEGGGKPISSVCIHPDSTGDSNSRLVSYNVTIPDDAQKGDYSFTLKAAAQNESESDLQVHVSVTDEAAGSNILETTYPEQQGDSSKTFTFNSTIRNNSSSEQTYSLSAEAPAGWSVSFKASGTAVSSVEVNGHGTQAVTVTVTPPASVEAGTYTIPVKATSSSQDLEQDLKITITGTYALDVQTTDSRLSFDANVGKTQTVALNVINNGNIDLQNINLNSQAPSGWTVEFSESTIDLLPAGQTKEITVNVTPGKEAMSGDYIMKISAKNNETSIDQSFRVTVKTSTLWGITGICLIGLILLGVSEVFRRFGRH